MPKVASSWFFISRVYSTRKCKKTSVMSQNEVELKKGTFPLNYMGWLTFSFFFFLNSFSGGKCRDLARVPKNHHYVVYGLYFDPMTPPFLGVLKSQSRTSAHLGSIPGRVSYSTPAPFWRLYMQYTQLGISHWGTRGSPRADSWTFCLYWQKAVGPGIKTHHPPPQLRSNV